MKRRTTAIVFGAIAGSALLTGSGIMLASANGGSGDGKSHDSAERSKEAGHSKSGTPSGQPCVRHEDDDHSVSASRSTSGEHKEGGDDREHSGTRSTATHKGERDSHPAPSPTKTEKSDDSKNCVPSPGPSGAPAPSPSSSAPAPAPSPTGAPAPSPAATCSNYTGSTISTVPSPANGTVTVTITVCGGVITSASAVQVDNSGYSPNTAAIKTLNSLVPANYKTNTSAIHVSGATLTSNAYVASLQSARTKAGV